MVPCTATHFGVTPCLDPRPIWTPGKWLNSELTDLVFHQHEQLPKCEGQVDLERTICPVLFLPAGDGADFWKALGVDSPN